MAKNRAVKERLILRNPTEDCIAPKVQKFEMQILQPEYIKTYLDAADKRGLLPMFYLELVTGLRKGGDHGASLERPRHRGQDHLRQQAICQKPQWGVDTLAPQNGDIGQKSQYSTRGRRPAGCRTQETSRQPIYVPIARHRGDVLPRFHCEPA